MIQLGKIQNLEVIRKTEIGVYLNCKEDKNLSDILLPKKQVPVDIACGDEIEVFVYRDSEDRMIATVNKPKVEIDQIALLKVVEVTRIGAFLDWGLEKDLFLPFKQQVGEIEKGSYYLVGVYLDKSDRLCATMKVYDLLSSETPYKENDSIVGTIYNIKETYGAFVAVDNRYHGLVQNKELFGSFKIGDKVEGRVIKKREDGKLELSLRKKTYLQIEENTQKIMALLASNGGSSTLHDKTSPEVIEQMLGMSKAAFKRAVGRLMKEGAITLDAEGIHRNW